MDPPYPAGLDLSRQDLRQFDLAMSVCRGPTWKGASTAADDNLVETPHPASGHLASGA